MKRFPAFLPKPGDQGRWRVLATGHILFDERGRGSHGGSLQSGACVALVLQHQIFIRRVIHPWPSFSTSTMPA